MKTCPRTLVTWLVIPIVLILALPLNARAFGGLFAAHALRNQLKGDGSAKSDSASDESSIGLDFSEIPGGVSGFKDGASLITVPGVTISKDVPYGTNEKQKIDVYTPQGAHAAPMLVMVHGGGWRHGDKNYSPVVVNKGNHWLAKGFVFISINNRLLPEVGALEQEKDVVNALAFIQKNARRFGGDPQQMVLMGHSAGAHLVTLAAVNPAPVIAAGGNGWRATISLDSAAQDVPSLMTRSHHSLYDDAFGEDSVSWAAASPIDQATKNATPMLLICSSLRKDSCPPNHALAEKLNGLGVAATVMEQPLKHGHINSLLGQPGDYTATVDRCIDGALGRQ